MCNRYYPKTGNTYGSLDPSSPLSDTHTYLYVFPLEQMKRREIEAQGELTVSG